MRPILAVLFVLTLAHHAGAQEGRATNLEPLSFGFDQTIIDLGKVQFGPLEVDGFPPGAEVAALRGTFEGGPLEVVFRLPANYTVPNHSHTSAEVYLWVRGDFTYVHKDGSAVDLSGQSFISLPGSSIHALVCHDEPCMFYVRYSRSFDVQVHPMPEVRKISLDSPAIGRKAGGESAHGG